MEEWIAFAGGEFVSMQQTFPAWTSLHYGQIAMIGHTVSPFWSKWEDNISVSMKSSDQEAAECAVGTTKRHSVDAAFT